MVDERVWDVDVVPGSAGTRYVSLAVNSERRPVIAAWRDVESPQARLTLARHDGSSWQVEDVARTFGAHCSLVLDAADSPAIAFLDLDRPAVMLARRAAPGENWTLETVGDDAIGILATGPVVAINREGRHEVCFANDSGPQLATRDEGGNWSSRSLDVNPTAGNDVDFVIDDAMRYVLSREPLADRLVLLREQAGGWARLEPVPRSPRGGFLGDGPALAVDVEGRAHLAYWTHDGIVHASLAERFGWDWSTVVVIAAGDAGPGPDVAIDADGQPTVACPNPATGGVEVAWRDDSGWHRESFGEVSTPSGRGGFVSLAVDQRGVPHVAFVADDGGELAHARLNRAPEAAPVDFTTPVNVRLSGNLLAGTSDPEGDTISLATDPLIEPEHGNLRLQSDGSFTYLPQRGYNGSDRFEYEVVDAGGLTTASTATIEVVVPVLIETSTQPLDDGRRSSRVRSSFRSPQLNDLVGRLQRRVDDLWVDVRLGTGSRITQLVTPRDDEWETGPYRLEIRPPDRSYPFARSEEFDMPPARGHELVLQGTNGDQIVIRGNASRPHLELISR